jgi:hypothetical protein
MQTDEEVGKVAAPVPVIICILFFIIYNSFTLIIINFLLYFNSQSNIFSMIITKKLTSFNEMTVQSVTIRQRRFAEYWKKKKKMISLFETLYFPYL